MDFAKAALAYLLNRFGESSTWASLVAWVAAELQIKINADFDLAIVHIGVAIAALAGVLIKEGWQGK